jgi:hypothetical protein
MNNKRYILTETVSKSILIQEAKHRGFRYGVFIDQAPIKPSTSRTYSKQIPEHDRFTIHHEKTYNRRMFFGGFLINKKGVWAEPSETISHNEYKHLLALSIRLD